MNKLPHPPRLPFVGNMHQVLTLKPIQRFVSLGDKYGPVTELNIVGTKLICVYNYDMMQELFDESRFAKFIDLPFIYLREIAGDALFTAWTHEPNWKKAHNILMPGFAQRSIRGYFPVMIDVLQHLLAKWYNYTPETYFDITDQMVRFTFETIGLAGFGYRFNNFATDQQHPFMDAMTAGIQTALLRAKIPNWTYFLMFGRRKKYRQSVEYMNRLIDEIIQQRKANPDDYRNKTDLLSLMLNASDKETGEKLSDTNIRYQILTFLVAGHETTATLLSFTFHHLLQHPDVLERAYREVDAVFGDDPTKMPTYEQVMNLKYIQQILSECLRIQPPVPVIEMYSPTPTTLGGKYPIPADTAVLAFVHSLHRDRRVWGEDADEFNPDRFAPEAVAQRPAGAYKPFGNGVRACIGRQFALLEAALVLGAILHRYKFHGEPGYVLQTDELPTVKPVGFKLRIEPREAKDRFPVAKTTQTQTASDVEQQQQGQHSLPITVLYGSNMGTSEEFARRIAADARRRGFPVQLSTLDEAIDTLPRTGFLIIIASTYNGYPPDNATRFKEWLASADIDGSGVRYAVFGCGNSQWMSSFQAFPNWLDAQFQQKGYAPLLAKGQADASTAEFDEDFEQWYRRCWEAVYAALPDSERVPEQQPTSLPRPESLYALEIVESSSLPYTNTRPQHPQEQPFRLLANENLLAAEGDRATQHVELALPEGTSYQTGDHFAFYPQNSEELIAAIAAHFQLKGNTLVRLKARSPLASLPCEQVISVDDLLRHFVELQDTATRTQLADLAAMTECPPERQKLLRWAEEAAYKTEIVAKRRSVWDVLRLVPGCVVPFEFFLQLLPAMRPRYYSISSSALESPTVLSLTVGLLRAPHLSGEGLFQGVASSFWAQLKKDHIVHGFIKAPNSDYRMPERSETPLILVGAGTGISALRGFYRERHFQHKQGLPCGKITLFQGCRNQAEWLYADEQKRLLDALGEVYPAFSRVGAAKVYVQDLLREQGARVWDELQAGAVVYVCGDAAGMAVGVRQAFLDIYRSQNPDATAADAEAWMQALIHEGRYKTDVWTT